MKPIRARAIELDAADPLASTRDAFVDAVAGEGRVVAYLDGNSLGRPLKATRARIARLIDHDWGTRLIRSWDEQWMALPMSLGDRIGQVCLGAAPGQVVIGDSTTVMLYKLIHAALRSAPADRRRIVLDTENFPSDRYIAAGLAQEFGVEIDWITPDPAAGVTCEEVAAAVGEQTSIVVLSHVAYTSGWLADLPRITRIAHDAGALVLWDLCHASGVVQPDLDRNGVDLAVGCTYKFLNGGPGSPAFAYVAAAHQGRLRQPIQGWMGHAEPFVMGPDYVPGDGMRGFVSGTPSILGMAGIADTVDLIEKVGLDAIRAKSVELGEFACEGVEELLVRHGVRLMSPRSADRRGSHVSIGHERFRDITAALWREDIIPDFREPDSIRLGMAPLSTSFAEVARALTRIDELLGE